MGAVMVMLVPSVAACGDSGDGTPVIDLHIFPEDSGAFQQAVDDCTREANGRYRIVYHRLPRAADGQREQMVRRLAAEDESMDILGLDVIWVPEFAEAGWIREWDAGSVDEVRSGTLDVALRTATWEDRLYAAPFNSNTQLLWYRSDLVPEPPQTWDEMLVMAQDLANRGLPHTIQVQGAQYEGLTVWFNTMVESAGGSILTEDGNDVALGEPAEIALKFMGGMARSVAADPSLSNQMEDDNRLAMESGRAAFELNYPFVYPSMKANRPDLLPNFKWAQYPRVVPDEPSHVTVGGTNLAVSTYSPNPDLAYEAALCLRNPEHQRINAIRGGLPPSLREVYNDPQLRAEYPFADAIREALENASVRPQTPAYQNVSIVISHALSPPSGIRAEQLPELRADISDALESRGVIP
jgi:multiple sugar transport system substrate-binding protein